MGETLRGECFNGLLLPLPRRSPTCQQGNGGILLGSAVPANGKFHIVVELPRDETGEHSLWFYAHSAATDASSAVEVPVSIE